jgi:hypothetical protein
MPDYEVEREKLTAFNHELKLKLSDAETCIRELNMEICRMKAQLDMVYLIFGGKGVN